MNGHRVTKAFEQALCEYTGAQFAVSVNSCTMALLLAVAWHYQRARWLAQEGDQLLAFLQRPFEVEIPKHTYIGVPMSIIHAGGKPRFRDEDWGPVGGYQLRPLPVHDCARAFTSNMYDRYAGSMVCVSFHWSKILGLSQGGAILLDDYEAAQWLRKARFDGRTEGVPPAMDRFEMVGWHCYLSPEVAAHGLMKLAVLPKHNAPLPVDLYPDLSEMEIFK